MGKGTIFTVTLSFNKSQQQVTEPDKPYFNNTFQDLGHVRLLLVEDNEINQLIATRFLEKWGIRPDYAINGKVAVEMVQQQAYDLILMDLQMPEMDGFEATRLIRNLNRPLAQVPIIALTASAMLDVRDKAMKFGINDFVSKPFNPNELYVKIVKYTKSETFIKAAGNPDPKILPTASSYPKE